jgi:hypothetical protein
MVVKRKRHWNPEQGNYVGEPKEKLEPTAGAPWQRSEREPETHSRSTMAMNRRIPTRTWKLTCAFQSAVSFAN